MKTIDIHAHWYPEEWLRLFEKDGAKEGASLERKDGKYHLKAKHITNAFDERFVVVEERIKVMDRIKVDVHALSLTTPMVYWASPGFGLALSQAFNDAASAAHRKHPDRLLGLAMLPMQSPSDALRELERAAKLPGIRGLYLSTNVNNEELDEKKFWDVYGKCEELGWTIYLHPVDTVGQDRTKKYYLKNLCGNPYDTGIAAAHLIMGGVLDRFPKLGFNLPHAGGTFPWLVGRWERGRQMRPELKHMKQPIDSYLKRFTYDTIGHDDRINMALVKLVGADRVTLGSDYCFDMGLDDPLATVARLDIPESDKALIRGANALKLLRL
ncbi:MAG: aminocarboxymuconate-semialdehyde decarboxylase [Betaproteobacteria bacterium]|jgi:aminocarboxymuconate-semialdehyde decarboxylase|nr:aminocarboxymuconate-semialdehyde decarboxylase [Betaproteobacteria bacterium]